MYYRGIETPDREPSRNRFSEKKSKFTEKVAKDVQHGDLYFAQRTRAHQRFYVPIEAGEHGLEESGLYCVTHIFDKPFPDLDGRWKEYDGGGNLVIKIRQSDDDSLAYSAREAIEMALYRTPLGRVVGRDALRAQAESLCTAFGIDTSWRDEKPSTFTVNTDAEETAKDALRELLLYAPESGYPEELGTIGAEYDGVGFANGGVEYASLLNGESNGFGEEGRGKPLPLLSQPVFYAVLGSKGDGRGMQSRIDALMEAVGLHEDDL